MTKQKTDETFPATCKACGQIQGLCICEAAAKPDVDAVALLERAADLQTAFWEAISELEDALGCDVDQDLDLENQTVESLLEKGGE